MLSTVLFIVALILGSIDLVRSRFESLSAWAIAALALGLTLDFFRSNL